MHRLTAILLIAFASAFAAVGAHAQDDSYKYDLGVQLGMSGYLGDVNSSNLLKHPGFAAGASFRYLPVNNRMAVRTVFNTMSLSGNTADFDDVFPGGAQYSFKSQVYELNCRYEFYFFPYGIGETYKRMRRWTPYLALGAGLTLATCDGQVAVAPAIPMAVGLKYKLRPRWNLAVEFAMTKVFGDKIDGALTDLYDIKSSFIKNTDWYSNFSVSITYEFGKRCSTCHYVD